MKGKLYYPQLDSIRGLSFLGIFIYHATRIIGGENLFQDLLAYIYNSLPFALEVFFVLSAFLLTWLALNEYEKKGQFSFKNYFTRRILRIWPLYYLIMIFSFLFLPLMAERFHISISLPPPAWYLFFVSNFYAVDHVYFLRFLWTLSVEEQFYLILGICLKFFSTHIRFFLICFLGASAVFSIYATVYDFAGYEHTLTYFFDFAVGGMTAVILFKKQRLTQLFSRLTKKQTIVFYSYLPVHFTVFFFICRNTPSDYHDFLNLTNRYMFIIYLALLIIEQLVNNNRSKFLEQNRFLIYTGKISFGLYCFHGITLTFANALFPCIDCIPFGVRLLAIFAVNYGVAVISYYYFESPFLRLKERFRKI